MSALPQTPAVANVYNNLSLDNNSLRFLISFPILSDLQLNKIEWVDQDHVQDQETVIEIDIDHGVIPENITVHQDDVQKVIPLYHTKVCMISYFYYFYSRYGDSISFIYQVKKNMSRTNLKNLEPDQPMVDLLLVEEINSVRNTLILGVKRENKSA